MSVPQHFSIVLFDVESSGTLSGPEKVEVRRDLYEIVGGALEQAKITQESVHREDRGDGIFLLIAADVSKRRLIDPFGTGIDEALRMRRMGDTGLRLRTVVHQGEVIRDRNGSSGPALDDAFAMLDAEEVKAALQEARQGRMALVVPDDLYRSVVRGYPQPDPDAFRMRRLETKRGRFRTWVTVTGAREQPGSGRREPDKPPTPAAAPGMTVHNGDNVKVRRSSGFVGTNRGGTVNIGPARRDRGDG